MIQRQHDRAVVHDMEGVTRLVSPTHAARVLSTLE